MLSLQVSFVIVGEYPLESGQQVVLKVSVILELTLIEEQGIVAHQQDVVLHDAVGLWRLLAMVNESPYHPHQLPQQLLLTLGGVQRLVHVVGEKVIVLQALLEHRTAHEICLEVHGPAVIDLACAVVCFPMICPGEAAVSEPFDVS